MEYGCTRMVLLVGGYAIKFPTLAYDVRSFLHGLIHNIAEQEWWRGGDKIRRRLCPVVFGSRFGIFVVMKRAKPLRREYECPVFLAWLCERFQFEADCFCPAERKSDSWGELDGEVVAVDYA